MAIINDTTSRGYPLPNSANKLKDDVPRIRASFSAIDADIVALLQSVSLRAMAEHSHEFSDIPGLTEALDGKAAANHVHALDDLSDVSTLGAANGQVLIRQGAQWIPANLAIANIANLGVTLDAKADANAVANALGLKAPIESPTFTGSPSAPTAATEDNSTKLANTSFVQSVISAAFNASGALLGNLVKNTILASAEKTVPHPDDRIYVLDAQVAGWGQKWFSWGTILNTIKASFGFSVFFQTLFASANAAAARTTLGAIGGTITGTTQIVRAAGAGLVGVGGGTIDGNGNVVLGTVQSQSQTVTGSVSATVNLSATGSVVSSAVSTNAVTIANNVSGAWNETITMFDRGILLSQNIIGQALFLYFLNSGRTLIGSISSDNATVYYNNASDERLKENFEAISDYEALGILDQLHPVYYEYKVAPGKLHLGFLAHEVQEVMPWLVQGERNGERVVGWTQPDEGDDWNTFTPEPIMGPAYQEMDYSKLTPLLTAALRAEKKARLALEARVEQLEALN